MDVEDNDVEFEKEANLFSKSCGKAFKQVKKDDGSSEESDSVQSNVSQCSNLT